MVKKGLGHKFLNLITALPDIVLFSTHIHDSIILLVSYNMFIVNTSGVASVAVVAEVIDMFTKAKLICMITLVVLNYI